MKRYVLTRCAKWLGIFLLAGGVIFYILQLALLIPASAFWQSR